ncbi:MAG: TIGR03943 family protein [Actinobacteria bacterium]|nr:TIGR03943 family protein [Actinomycetota bacterium]
MNRPGFARMLLLAAWSAFFAWLLVSGEVYRYIGPKTRWVVVFGAVMLGFAAIAQARSLRRTSGNARISPTELLTLAAFVAPMAIIVLIPRPSLGSEAAARKSTGLVGAASSFVPVPQGNGKVSFSEIQYASESADYAAAVGIVDGYEVKLTGFVTHPDGDGEGTFTLTRFATFCCAADAVPYSVTVDPGGKDYPDDTWLTVSGSLVSEGGEFVLQAARINETEEPDNPYI